MLSRQTRLSYHVIVKLYPLLSLVLLSTAYAQTAVPKPSAAPQLPPGQESSAPPVKGPLADLDPNRVIATVGTEKMTAAQFDALVEGLPPQTQAYVRGPGKRQFMDRYVQIKVMANQAGIMHVDQVRGARQTIQFEEDKVLANLAFKAILENAKVDSAMLHKYYDEHTNDFQTISAHQILIRFKGSPVPVREGQKDLTEEEALAKAQELQKRLKAGEDFATIARDESADPKSAPLGGDVGTPFRRGQVVKPFEDAAFSLPVGQISDPVKSSLGYHIIRVDKNETKTFDEVKAEIESKLRLEMARKEADELKSAVEVKLDEKFFAVPVPGTTAK
jgi:peptidyl-prolyl cis-trans isomerase C